MAVEQLALEQRRHFRVSFGLVLACLAAAVAVQNERGVFVPVGFGDALEGAAKAFALVGPNGRPLQLMSYGPPVTPGVDQNPLPRALAARVLEPAPAPLPGAPNEGPVAQAPAFANNAAGAPGAGFPGASGPGTPFSSFTPNASPVLTPIGAGGVPSVGQDDDTDTPTNPETPPTGNPGTPGTPPTDNPGTPGIPPTDNPGTPGGNPPAGPGEPGTNQPVPEQPGPTPPVDEEPRPPIIVPPTEPPIIITPVIPRPGPPDQPIEQVPGTNQPPVAPVPEPATWGMMLLGFGLMGASVRARYRRRREA